MSQFLLRNPKPWFAGIIASLIISNSHAFNYDQYQPGSLDEILNQPRPAAGVDILTSPKKLRFEVKLTAYAEDCNTGFLKTAMVMLGTPRKSFKNIPISKCIKVKSTQDQIASMYIQDKVAAYLPEEVPLDTPLTIFVDYLFVDGDGPGILVNAFDSTKK